VFNSGLFLISAQLFNRNQNKKLPVIAIANYGPHASLDAAITGFQEQMRVEGYFENENIQYEIADVGFDPSLIPQMLLGLKAKKPKLILVMTTPVAQLAKSKIKDVPLIFTAITDPIKAGLLKEAGRPDVNMTGSSDMQDLNAFLKFAKTILPTAKRIGILYSSSESNDAALVDMMTQSASALEMTVLAIPIDHPRDIPVKILNFKSKVDFIYVGTSGPIQPALPVIAAEAQKMNIPVFNVEAQAVQDGLALASFGVEYKAVGRNAAKLAAAFLNGEKIENLTPIYPTIFDHHGLINKKIATDLSLNIPLDVEEVA
jgi:putative tryptophan/tyrosine transport system substrate-binding protein